MAPFRNNVISIVTARAVLAAIAEKNLVPERRAMLARTRAELCSWLRAKGVMYLEPQANVGRDAEMVKCIRPELGVGSRNGTCQYRSGDLCHAEFLLSPCVWVSRQE